MPVIFFFTAAIPGAVSFRLISDRIRFERMEKEARANTGCE